MMRNLVAGKPTNPENNWNLIKHMLKRIWQSKKVPAKEIINPSRPLSSAYNFLGIFTRNIPQRITPPSLSVKEAAIQNARFYALQFNIGSLFPTFKRVISRLFQLGFVGFVCTHQQLYHEGHGFIIGRAIDSDISALVEIFRREPETKTGEDAENDIIILSEFVDDDINDYIEEITSTKFWGPNDIREFAVMNLIQHDKLKQLVTLCEQLVAEKIQQEKELKEVRESEKYFKMKCEQLEKFKEEMFKREKKILKYVKKMKEVVDDHAQSTKQYSKHLEEILFDNNCEDEETVIKTFIQKEDRDGLIVL